MLRSVLTLTCLLYGSVASLAQDARALYRQVKNSVVVIETDEGTGTGFFVDSGRYLVTAAHVLKNVRSIQLQGTALQVSGIVHYDEEKDIALLALEKKSKQSLRLQTQTPEPGTKIYVVGTPLGVLERSISDGIVSAVRKLSRGTLIQFTAPISPGSSGSPLVSQSGRVLGLVLLHLKDGQALNFAVSAKDIASAIVLAKTGERKLAARPNLPKTGNIIGKLGQTIADSEIRASPNPEARIYYITKKYQYLVVNSCEVNDWLKVLLQNGRSGYIEASKVAQLPYDVRVKSVPDSEHPTVEPLATGGEIPSVAGPKIAEAASNSVEWPYKKGGTSLADGCDEVSFARLVLEKVGISIPRHPEEQAKNGMSIDRFEHLQPGDVVCFWGSAEGRIAESGIFIGFKKGRAFFVHASHKEGKIMVSDLSQKVWREKLVAARRS